MAVYLNKNLKYLRQLKGISQQELANKMGIDRSTISRIENNEIDTTIDNAIKISEILNVPLADLLGKDLKFDNATYMKMYDDNDNMVSIPVLGVIKAGIPIDAQENILEYTEIPKNWIKGNKKFYGLKISGDSMYPKYQEDDIVIFEDSREYPPDKANNKDCAVMINGYDATFKKVLINTDGITLVPYNTGAYDIKMYSNKDIEDKPIRIIGIAKEKRTKLN